MCSTMNVQFLGVDIDATVGGECFVLPMFAKETFSLIFRGDPFGTLNTCVY